MLTGRAAPFAEVTPRLTGTDFSGRMMSPNVILSRFAGDAWDPPLKRRVFVCLSLATPFQDLRSGLRRDGVVKRICAIAATTSAVVAGQLPAARLGCASGRGPPQGP